MRSIGKACIASALLLSCGRGVGGGGSVSIGTPPDVAVSVAFAGNGSGHVTSSPPGIDCPGSCSMAVTAGSTVALTPAPAANSQFNGWGGGCSGPGACEVVAKADVTVWADFQAKKPPPDPCVGIAAPDGVAMQQYVTAPHQGVTCYVGVGDANGTLAFPLLVNSASAHGTSIEFVSSGNVFLREGSSAAGGPRLIQQPSGVASAGGPPHFWPFGPAIDLGRWDTNGFALGETTWLASNSGVAGDPSGGVLLAGDLSSSVSAPLSHSAAMFTGGDKAAGVRWGPNALAASGPVFGAGVDTLGRSLVITGRGSDITAQWFERDGTPLTGEFTLVTGFSAAEHTWFETSALIGGGLAVLRMDLESSAVSKSGNIRAHALVVVSSGAASVQPAPDWMAQRPDRRLQIARGGRAYAALPLQAAGASCTQTIEVVSAEGASCGSRDYAIAAGTCDTNELTLAADGTVIQQLPASMETSTSAGSTCTWRFWTRALR
ncbi:MAG: hypothetical protein E6J78_03385 [Deltaproteobacteria bacterium]|nr:MAG: hypothetical protein E6J78_03385 [Deltaproteobacteria bacterium]